MITDDTAETTPAPLFPEYFVSVKMETNSDVSSLGKHYYSSKKLNSKYPASSVSAEVSLLITLSCSFFNLCCFRLLWIKRTMQHNHRFCKIKLWIVKYLTGSATSMPIHCNCICQILRIGLFYFYINSSADEVCTY